MENEIKPDETIKKIVVGVATGSRDVETWVFDGDDYRAVFCEQLVRSTGRSVWVIEGKILGRYTFEEQPVVFKEK